MPEEIQTPEPVETPAVEAQQPANPAPTPPWGSDDEFDPEKAWNLIQGLRTDKDRLSTRATEFEAKVKEYEDAKLTAEEKAARDLKEQQSQAATLASENALLKAAIDHHLSAKDLDLLRGLPPDAIADRAAKLAARLGAGTPPKPLTARPREALRGGADPTAPATGSDWLRNALAGND